MVLNKTQLAFKLYLYRLKIHEVNISTQQSILKYNLFIINPAFI